MRVLFFVQLASESVADARALSASKEESAAAASNLRQARERVSSLEHQLQLLTARVMELQGQLDDAAGRNSETAAALVLENDSLKEKIQSVQASLGTHKQDAEQAFARAAALTEDVKVITVLVPGLMFAHRSVIGLVRAQLLERRLAESQALVTELQAKPNEVTRCIEQLLLPQCG